MTDKTPAPETAPAAPRRPGTGTALLLDYGPLLVFFLANFFAPVPDAVKIFAATGVFMAAMLVAMMISQICYRYISPMLWFSGIMVIIFGGLTIWLHDPRFIKIKPTIYYTSISLLLTIGLVKRWNLLKYVLGPAYPGLRERGWTLLTRNWIGFFIVMAVVNEAIWRTMSTEFWMASKLWLFLPMTFIFAAANVPMLLRHGLADEQPAQVPQAPPE